MTAERLLAATSLGEVAAILETTEKALRWYLYRSPPEKRYLRFAVPKKSGGTRSILAPATALKRIQGRLRVLLQEIYRPPNCAHGFILGRSILSNAKLHVGATFVLNIDLKDFFPSIHIGRVHGLFCKHPMNMDRDAATVIAQICCHDNALPQGAPTSPIVSNMICRKLDQTLYDLARRYRCRYTRYADDITMSTTQGTFPSQLARLAVKDGASQVIVGRALAEAIEANGFALNPGKTRLASRSDRLDVTGLTVNELPNVGRKFIRQLRAMLYDWETTSLEQAEERHLREFRGRHRNPHMHAPSFRDVVRGKLNYLRFIKTPNDPTYGALRSRFEKLDHESTP